MTTSIVVLTEQALGIDDARRLRDLHPGDTPDYHMLIPADTHGSLLAEVLDDLSLLKLRKALKAVRGHDQEGRPSPQETLHSCLVSMRAAGATVDGRVASGDPVTALGEAVQAHAADEVIVVTRPHAVEDTFHTDWASRAREQLGVPVLHLYAGSGWVGG